VRIVKAEHWRCMNDTDLNVRLRLKWKRMDLMLVRAEEKMQTKGCDMSMIVKRRDSFK